MSRELRSQITDLSDRLDRLSTGRSNRSPVILGTVISGGVVSADPLPTSLPATYACFLTAAREGASEGSAGFVGVDTSRVVYITVVGGKAPLAGDLVIARRVGHAWVGESYGIFTKPVVSVPGCPCTTMPTTLTMSVNLPMSNHGIFQNCTIQYYSPVPSQFASLAPGPYAFLSTVSFTDDSLADPFWYYLNCFQGNYVLSRIYVQSFFGSAFRDSIRYRWIIGFPGNTCSPFLLSNGVIFAGGDATCVVTISE